MIKRLVILLLCAIVACSAFSMRVTSIVIGNKTHIPAYDSNGRLANILVSVNGTWTKGLYLSYTGNNGVTVDKWKEYSATKNSFARKNSDIKAMVNYAAKTVAETERSFDLAGSEMMSFNWYFGQKSCTYNGSPAGEYTITNKGLTSLKSDDSNITVKYGNLEVYGQSGWNYMTYILNELDIHESIYSMWYPFACDVMKVTNYFPEKITDKDGYKNPEYRFEVVPLGSVITIAVKEVQGGKVVNTTNVKITFEK